MHLGQWEAWIPDTNSVHPPVCFQRVTSPTRNPFTCSVLQNEISSHNPVLLLYSEQLIIFSATWSWEKTHWQVAANVFSYQSTWTRLIIFYSTFLHYRVQELISTRACLYKSAICWHKATKSLNTHKMTYIIMYLECMYSMRIYNSELA